MSLKTLIGTAIISLGVAGIIFVVQNSAPQLNQNSKIESIKNNNSISDKPFIEPIADSQNLQPQNNPANDNLTEVFAKGIGQAIKQNNLPGPQSLNGQNVINVPDADAVANNLIQEATQKFDPSSLRPIIKDSDLIISQDNSKEAIKNYINDFQKIVKDASLKIPQSLFLEELTLGKLAQLINIYGETINKFYKLNVPSSAISMHKKQLELLIAKKNIFEKITAYENDPIASMLAAQELQKVDSEFVELSKIISGFKKQQSI